VIIERTLLLKLGERLGHNMIKLKDILEYRLPYKGLWNEAIQGLEVKSIAKADAAQFVLNHYLGDFPSVSQYYFGIYLEGELIGCVIYGPPTGPSAWSVVARGPDGKSLLTPQEVKELQRLFIIEKPGVKFLESSVLAKANKYLAEIDPKVKVVVTYADPQAGHVGAIYQATNAAYQGRGKDQKSYFIQRKDKPDKAIRGRDLKTLLTRTGRTHLIGGSTEDILKSGLPITQKKVYGKYRYVYIIRNEKQLKPFVKKDYLKYPKKDELQGVLDPDDWAALQRKHKEKEEPEPPKIDPEDTGWIGESYRKYYL
jgi:hypothetical protein